MKSDLILGALLLLIITLSLIYGEKLEKIGEKWGNHQGQKKRKKYESQPKLTDIEILKILRNHRKHSVFHISHVVREANKRSSPEVKNALEHLHKKTRNRYLTNNT